MNRFSVVWTQEAADELAEVWLAADDRQQVTGATETIDRMLSIDPLDDSTVNVAEGLRKVVVYPLMAMYSIKDDTRGSCVPSRVMRWNTY